MITSPAIAATQVSRDYQVPGRKDVTVSDLRNVSYVASADGGLDQAAAGARRRLVHSTSQRPAPLGGEHDTITPFAIAVGLSGVINALLGASQAQGGEGTAIGFLAVAVPIFVISAVGGVANIAMVGRTRRRQAALLGVLGARPATTAWTGVFEGVIYAVTGVLFGLVATALAVVLAVGLDGGGLGAMVAATPWQALAPLSIGSVVLSVLTGMVPSLARGRSPLMESLRAPV